MGTKIHATAIVDAGAELGESVEIGPYCCVGPNVRMAEDVVLRSHVVADGHTVLGARTEVFPFATVGLQPQDLKYGGEASTLTVGDDTTIREHVTLHPGTAGGGMATRVGAHCLLMVGAHIAHDCQIGDHVIMANNATLGGHVVVGDFAFIGGLSAVHQFVRIGAHAMIGGMTGVENDVIPFGSVMGERGRLSGLNMVGLKRRGFTKGQQHNLRGAYRMLFSADSGTVTERLDEVAARYDADAEVMEIVRFIRDESSRGLTQPKPGNGG